MPKGIFTNNLCPIRTHSRPSTLTRILVNGTLFFACHLPLLNPNQSLDRICFVLLLPVCFPTAFVRLPTSALPLHLAVARYAFAETSAHLLNNRTKSVQGSNDRILCFPPNKILFLTLLLTVAFQEFRLFSIHSSFVTFIS